MMEYPVRGSGVTDQHLIADEISGGGTGRAATTTDDPDPAAPTSCPTCPAMVCRPPQHAGHVLSGRKDRGQPQGVAPTDPYPR